MSVIIKSTDTLKNDDLWNEWSDQLAAVIMDTDTKENDDDKLLNSLCNVKKSKKFAEKATTFGTLGNMQAKTEGANAAEDTFEEGYAKILQHTTFGTSVTISRELAEDSQIDMMKARAASLIQSYKRSKAQFASNLITGGSTATFTYEGKTYDATVGDGLPLFSTAHTLKSVSGSTESNLFATALTDATVLNQLANVMRNYTDDKGHVEGLTADTIIIPGNAAKLEDLCKKIIGSDGEVGTDHNDVNTQRGKWKLVVDYLWTPTVASSDPTPYILMSSKANKDLLGNMFYNRVDLDVKAEVKTESRNLLYNGYTRWSAGCFNWRHMIMGGSKVSGASVLS